MQIRMWEINGSSWSSTNCPFRMSVQELCSVNIKQLRPYSDWVVGRVGSQSYWYPATSLEPGFSGTEPRLAHHYTTAVSTLLPIILIVSCVVPTPHANNPSRSVTQRNCQTHFPHTAIVQHEHFHLISENAPLNIWKISYDIWIKLVSKNILGKLQLGRAP